MSSFVQTVVALLIVAAAVIYLLFQFGRTFAQRRQHGCGGGCVGCSAAQNSETQTPTIVPIDALTATAAANKKSHLPSANGS